MAPSDPAGHSAAELIQHCLGTDAAEYYRSSNRTFPLQHEGVYFSVSHTHELTAVAFAATPVGVDVERHLPTAVALEMSWAFSCEERLELIGAADARLTEIWTAKEASGKVLGIGLGGAPQVVRTLPILRAPGQRLARVLIGASRISTIVSHGWWQGTTHIRLAWHAPANDADFLTA